MATATVNYSSNTSITISPASLASSSTLVAGRESNEIDNTSNKYVDALLSGKITVGTTPTANTVIGIYVWGAETSLGATAIDVLDGTDSAETLTNTGVLGNLRLAGAIAVLAATSDITYYLLPTSVAALFGGVMPKYWGLFIAHNTGVNLNSTSGNHAFEYVGIKHDVA